MKKKKDAVKDFKKEVGERFKLFRLEKKKAQHVLASELKIHQSTITNIEQGTTHPKLSYLKYFYEKYGLNLNWLITGDGKRFMENADTEKKGTARIMITKPSYNDAQKEKYRELDMLMRIPAIEQVMFAKLIECKILFKDHVNTFLDNQEKEKRQKKRKASRLKVKNKR